MASAPTWVGKVMGSNVTFRELGDTVLRHAHNTYTSPTSWRHRSYFFDEGPDENICEVSLGRMTFAGTEPTDAEFLAYFAPGTRTYSGSNGVIMSANVDGADLAETTDLFQAQPSSSNFSITHVEEIDDGSGVYTLKVRCTFTVRLFTWTGGSIDVTDGVAVLIFKNE